jgi:hypothetical protein
VRPGAKLAAVVGVHGARLKIAIAAPPVEGKANDALLELLAGLLGLPRRQLHLQAGATSREKTVRVEAINAADVVRRLVGGKQTAKH